MLFNSFQFAILLITVFALFWSAKKQVSRNVILLGASYVFYGFWDWRFLSLIVISSLTDYLLGKEIFKQKAQNKRRLLLVLSLFVNLGFLGFFKYYNFFIDSFIGFSHLFGWQVNPSSINVILPVGISFYTFQTLSYTIDIYRGRLKPTTNILSFFTFVAFFPQLVAGPIERASNLLPQFQTKKKFNRTLAEDGLKQMLWGFFKKMVIADNAALIANNIFSNSSDASSKVLVVGLVLFAFQIYADFSGYSDIAIGTAKLFGIRLMTNFKTPYFAASISEFWRRWHISLSTWFRDYVYIPLGGSKNGLPRQLVSILLTFLLSGLWHGASFTFIAWGLIHALLYMVEMLAKRFSANVGHQAKTGSGFSLIKIAATFATVTFAWLFFRAEKIGDAFLYLKGIMHSQPFPKYYLKGMLQQDNFKVTIVAISVLVLIEWFSQTLQHPFENSKKMGMWRYVIYILLVLIIFLFAPGEKADFIYFQF